MSTGVEVCLRREDNEITLNLENGQISVITKEMAEEEKTLEEETVNGGDAEALISVLEEVNPTPLFDEIKYFFVVP
jgi:hypothetical protein